LKISIITVAFNNKSVIKDCINSVYKQSYSNIEHIIVDGNSKDGTLDVIQKYKKKNTKIISEPDKGIYDALNKGIKIATGDVIGILHADDVFKNNQVLKQVIKLFKQNIYIDALAGNVVFFNTKKNNIENRIIRSDIFRPWMLRFGFMPAHTATFIKRSVFKKFGLYDASFKSAGDFEFLLKLILVNKVKFFYLKKTLVRMRTGGVSTSGMQSYTRTSIEILYALRKNGFYSNYLFVLLRLPVKQIGKWIFKLRNLK
jgi:glycosyltransferase involved in cell wall biosynthesis